MPKIAVFTPTAQFGGLDITWSSLVRQTVANSIEWIVADTKLDLRADLYLEMKESRVLAGVTLLEVPLRPGYDNNLASSYVAAMEAARKMGADLFISLQDYIYLDEWMVERWAGIAMDYPTSFDLVSGLCSMADNPGADAVADPEGLYSVFAEPFISRPEESYWWSDLEVRGLGRLDPPGLYITGSPYDWELNWCMIPRAILRDDSLNFDPEFDRGIGKDHQVYALQCTESRHGSKIIVDTKSHAIGLPHKLYFPGVTDSRGQAVEANVVYAREKYGI